MSASAAPSLRHFILRAEALNLYRAIWRSTSARVAPYIGATERAELRAFARHNFQSMRGTTRGLSSLLLSLALMHAEFGFRYSRF
jgi:hypothetical protein